MNNVQTDQTCQQCGHRLQDHVEGKRERRCTLCDCVLKTWQSGPIKVTRGKTIKDLTRK